MDGGAGMTALPAAFAERMSRQLGNELPAFLHALELPPVRGIRLNPEKDFPGSETIRQEMRIPWTEEGYVLPADSAAGSTVFHEAGAFYLQEPAAMLPAEAMGIRPGEKILDLCAAPGGKATQMALKLHGEGLIVCNDPVPKRAVILNRNIERIGIANSIVISCMPEKIPESWESVFDGVLVDAPCSGEGMFRREPDTRNEWSPEKASGCAERQREILKNAARFVKPGGRLVYSTCTYNPEENEENVAWFLRTFPEFSPEPFLLSGAEGCNGRFLCLPHRIKGEGQFTAKLRKSGSAATSFMQCALPVPSKEELQAFRKLFPGLRVPNRKFGNTLVYIDECPELKGIRVLRTGLHLAECRGNILIPDHAAALCPRSGTAPVTELPTEKVPEYIAGLESEGGIKGWTLMQYKGLRLGWGKGSGSSVKNHYPKGLRRNRIVTEL